MGEVLDKKRIVKNAALLYIRMFITMAISFYTSRVVLSALGVLDYGIYSVVLGVVSAIGFLNGPLSWSTMRFLTFDLGKNSSLLLQRTFSMCMLMFVGLSIVFLFLSETFGLWFVNDKLLIDETRISAANWIYQIGILTSILNLLSTPYSSMVFAHEDLDFYAYVSVGESILRLLVVFLISISPIDKLVFFVLMLLIISFIKFLIQYLWCKVKYQEADFIFYWNRRLFFEIATFSGWNIMGSLATMAKGSGINAVLNMFFSTAVNAASGLAALVNAVIYQFFSNFFTAVSPQITKSYAQGNLEYMNTLVLRSSRFLLFLVMLVAIPLVVETPTLISLWLGQEPEYVVVFARLTVIITAIDTTAYPLNVTAEATGNIKVYNITNGLLCLLNLPFAYMALKLGAAPQSVFIISLVIASFCVIARVWAVKRIIRFSGIRYLKEVWLHFIIVCILSSIPIILFHNFIVQNNWLALINCALSVILSVVIVGFIGMYKTERQYIFNYIKEKKAIYGY